MQIAIKESITLGYIDVGPMKNKDMNAWTQPKDPLTVKMEQFMAGCSNIYKEDLFQHQMVDANIQFLPSQDQVFVKSYSDEHFQELIKDELEPIDNLMLNHPDIGRYLRMKVIDWLYEIINKF